MNDVQIVALIAAILRAGDAATGTYEGFDSNVEDALELFQFAKSALLAKNAESIK